MCEGSGDAVIDKIRRIPALAVAVAITVVLLLTPLTGVTDNMDGVIMSRGKVMMMKSGKPAAPMTTEITMSNGTTVTPDGTVKMKNGATLHLKNGQMVMMDGKIMEGERSTRMANPRPAGPASEQ
jgi:hypothetical protein